MLWAMVCAIGSSVPAAASSWSRDFGSHAFDLEVRELLVDGAELVAVGPFTQTPDGLAAGVAVWDGVAWRAMGDGLQGIVSAIVVHDGARVAGGAFAVAGEYDYDHVARWNGARWVPLPSPGGQVRDLAVAGETLYAAGIFPVGEGRHAPAARWTGSAWEPLGSAAELVPISPVALVEYDGRLVLGGRFPAGADPTPALVLAWNGAEWDTLARGVGFVRALAVHEGELHVGGSWSEIDGASGPVIAWNGARWRSVLTAEWSGSVEHLRSDTDGLLVAGFLAEGTEARRHRVLNVSSDFGSRNRSRRASSIWRAARCASSLAGASHRARTSWSGTGATTRAAPWLPGSTTCPSGGRARGSAAASCSFAEPGRRRRSRSRRRVAWTHEAAEPSCGTLCAP
jgi:hypothetical protein